jgi:hypothetical protein
MNQIKALCLAAAASTLALSGQAAWADTVLSIDLNEFTVGVTGPAGGPGVRTLSLSENTNTSIAQIRINNVNQALTPVTGAIDDWDGTLIATGSATAGTVTGFFTLMDDLGATYSVAGLAGTYGIGIDGSLQIFARTIGGLLSTTTFEGVDVTYFDANEPLTGSIFEFNLAPATFASGGSQLDVNAEITAVVPVPAAAWSGLALMGAIGTNQIRKRRTETL